MAGSKGNFLPFFSGSNRSCRDDGCLHTGRFMGLQRLLFMPLFMAFMFALSGAAASDAGAGAEPAVRSAAEIEYPPFSIVDEHGYATGFSVELLRAALAAMDRDVTFKTGQWSQVKGWLARGKIQALPLVGRTPERELLFDFTFPYMTLHGAIVVRKGTTGITDIKHLKGKQVAVMKGDNAEEFLRRKDRGIDIISRPTFEIALRELADGSHDAVFIQRLVALRLIQENGITGLEVSQHPIADFSQDFCFAVTEGDKDTLALLNEGLALVMADGTFRRLHARWFAALQLPLDRPVIIGGDHNYPPFEFLDENGLPAGFTVALTRAIAREMHMDIQIRLGPWADIVNRVKTGDIDAVQGMFYSADRDRVLDFSPPYLISYYVSVVQKGDGPPPETVADLAGKQLVVQDGDVILELLAKENLIGQVTILENQAAVLAAVSDGQYDCALVPRVSALYLIKENGWTNLDLGSRHFFSGEYGYAVKEGRHALLAQFSEGLQVLEQTGEYRRIHDKWLGVYQKEQMSVSEFLRYFALVIIPLILVIVAVFLWSWSLRRQVARKTRELRDSAQRFRTFAELAPVGIVISDEYQNTLYASPKFTEMFGYTLDDMPSVDKWWSLAYPDPEFRAHVRQDWQNAVAEAVRTHTEIVPREYPVTCKDGSIRHIEFRMATSGKLNIVVFTDISERKKHEKEQEKLQSQLLQAQKMESVGRLAGGVAHDFNNMLAVIIGYAELGVLKTTPENPLHPDMKEILTAARRSSEIIKQLLAFARKQTINPRVLDLNETVESMLKMLRRLIGEDIHLSWQPGPDVRSVYMDPTQVDQILANLVVNARDAITGVGRITIETENVRFDADYCDAHAGFSPGEFVMLAVSDDGCGMAQETRDKLFEPFFSTKEIGKGTGLGLATIYGIVKQNNGFINVYSEPGSGTTLRIYLPCHAGEPGLDVSENDTLIPEGRGETILIVEDEITILEIAQKMLEIIGYQVLVAPSAELALELAKAHGADIRLLISDVIMPEMNGRDLADRIQAFCPNLKILFMSGYTADVIAHRGILDAGVHFIQKPFSRSDLARKVRHTLDF